MEYIIRYLVTRFAPRVGWPIGLLLLAAAASPALAAGESELALPATLIGWAGVLGAMLGLRAGRLARPWLLLLGAPVVVLGAGLLVAAAGQALPPLSLLLDDLGALWGWLGQRWAGEPARLPTFFVGRFLSAALPRLWGQLVAAPGAGEAGAALLVGTVGLLATWAGALALGWAAGSGRPTGAWALGVLVALAGLTILGGGGGFALTAGMGLLLVLLAATGQLAYERAWAAAGAAFSDELRWGVLGWAAAGAALVLAVAWLVPTSLPSLGGWLGTGGDLPSGIAVIEQQVERQAPRPTAVAEVGLSALPAVRLGMSLELGPPEELALRVRVPEPLTPAPWPRYWRSRVLTRYDGQSWRAEVRAAPFSPRYTPDEAPPGAILQAVEDLREGRELLLALADPLWIDRPATVERLGDGNLAAAGPGGGRYSVLSLPQELAPPLDFNTMPPPDLGPVLALPPSLPPRVAELARTVAGGAATPLEQAVALEGYLRELPYAYTVSPLPEGGDAVDQFLFEMREGYCTYYASAMAVLARSLGIPARVAVGYATGTYDEVSGAYLVREADAHAWPELLIDGRWLPFEPTPVRPLPARAGEQPSAGAPAPVPTPAPTRQFVLQLSPTLLAGVAVALALGAVMALGVLAVRRARRSPLLEAQLGIERIGARAGVAWPAGATLHEYAALLAPRLGSASAALHELVALVEGARYGRRPLQKAQHRRVRQVLRELGRSRSADAA